ncbi:hypothetical protein [Kitasatospora purpeofusca]|uniref:hypothetical protein n=1 Tax=Kitasatospora purpeofusca TaxID=67352 RepID=UPI002A5A577A|nr:hypothetical protein [Kitasatospora purpeofusca]MDY0812961.1 hypothetical protein [Kitasatospora purpeofusca]
MTIHGASLAAPPPPPPPGQDRPAGPPGVDARSRATRLLAAGTYLSPDYRRAVIRELLTNRARTVAPSFGYDAVPVLAHALAARALQRNAWVYLGVGAVLLFVLAGTGVIGVLSFLLLVLWLCWSADYLRRVATLHTLITRLKDGGPGGFDGGRPSAALLDDELVGKIDREQSARDGLAYFGGYRPFVGAGGRLRRWSSAQLLLGAPEDGDDLSELVARLAGRTDPAGPQEPPGPVATRRRSVVPFDVAELAAFVQHHIAAELRDEARESERIATLVVERRSYARAVTVHDRSAGTGWTPLPAIDEEGRDHWAEGYRASREYLCARIGSWEEELVTSVFVGFDIRGNTLHTEFHSHVLTPVISEFHLVDRLPERLDGRLLLRAARDSLRHVLGRSWQVLLPLRPLVSGFARLRRHYREGRRFEVELVAVADSSEFHLGRYATLAVNRGARTSIRELACSNAYHHYFQESDADKYTRIVERRLLHLVERFLREHQVDLADHRRNQTTVLAGNHFGTGDIDFSRDKQVNHN